MDAARRVGVSTLAAWVVVLAACGGLESDPCGDGDGLRAPRFGEAATAQSLEGVVESETIAANPLPWGRSVSAVTRVWGGVTAERLVIGQRGFVSCPVRPSDPSGTMRYRFVGLDIEGVADQVVMSGRAGVEALIALDLNLGDPVIYEVTAVDRFMARLQAWLWELGVLVVALTGVSRIVFVVRRRGRERRGYLF